MPIKFVVLGGGILFFLGGGGVSAIFAFMGAGIVLRAPSQKKTKLRPWSEFSLPRFLDHGLSCSFPW